MASKGKLMVGKPRAFTLIELLVVIAIIALLVGILLPSLGKARRAAQATICLAQFKQYGLGMELYAGQYKEYLPTEGRADGHSPVKNLGPWDDGSFWANAIPGLMLDTQPSYYELQDAYLAGTSVLPGSKAKSIYVCPSAAPAAPGQAGSAGTYEADQGFFQMYGLAPGTTSMSSGAIELRPTYWCYVFNSGLDNPPTVGAGGTGGYIPAVADIWGTLHFKGSAFQFPQMDVLMVETMMTPEEATPPYAAALNYAKTKGGDTCRLSGRHEKSGNLLFVDGHVAALTRKAATTDVLGQGTYRIPGKVIWEPWVQD